MPEISVVIPTYNRCQYVQLAIDSALAQVEVDLEVIVIDDGSTDRTGEVLEQRYRNRICYIWQENQGESAARNRGIAMASGAYIALLDSDDLWLPHKSKRQLSVFSGNPAHCLVLCPARLIDHDGTLLDLPPLGHEVTEASLDLRSLYQKNQIAPSCTLIRRTELEQIGGFDPSIQYGEDWDLWLKLRERGSFGLVPEPLALYRQHAAAQGRMPPSSKVERFLQDRVKLLERAFMACPDMTTDLQMIRKRTLADQYAQAAFASYAWGNWQAGQSYLAQAIDLDTETWANGDQLAKMIISYGIALVEREGSLDTQHLEDYVHGTCRHLAPGLIVPTRFAERILGQLYADAAYRAYREDNSADVWRHTWRALRADPGLARNIGILRRLVAHGA